MYFFQVEDIRKRKREEELHKRMVEGDAETRKKARKKLNKLRKQKAKSLIGGIDSDSDSGN